MFVGIQRKKALVPSLSLVRHLHRQERLQVELWVVGIRYYYFDVETVLSAPFLSIPTASSDTKMFA